MPDRSSTQPAAFPIRIMLADSQPLLLNGLYAALSEPPDMTITGMATDGLALLQTLRDHVGEIDVVLMDYHLPLADGRACLEYIRWQRWPVRVVVLSTTQETGIMRAVLEFGAEGLLDKSIPPGELISMLRHIAGGMVMYPSSMQAWIRPIESPLAGLTEREASVLALVADGLTNPAIARQLVISENTVKTHLKNIFEKLGLTDRHQAATFHHRYAKD